MSKGKSDRYPPWVFLLIFMVMEVLGVLMFMSPQTIKEALNRERLAAIDQIGSASESSVHRAANRMFQASIIDSGLQKAAYETTGVTSNTDSEDMPTSKLTGFAVEHMQTAFGALYLLYYRIAGMAAWYPLLFPLLFASLLDGFVYWKVTEWRFSFASPAIHRFGISASIAIVMMALVAVLLPMPLTPFFAPTMTVCLSISMWMLISNMPKFW